MQLTKLAGASRQLKTAVEVYFSLKDEVSIHTLAAGLAAQFAISTNTVAVGQISTSSSTPTMHGSSTCRSRSPNSTLDERFKSQRRPNPVNVGFNSDHLARDLE
jgi:hypothetical protein